MVDTYSISSDNLESDGEVEIPVETPGGASCSVWGETGSVKKKILISLLQDWLSCKAKKVRPRGPTC